MREKGENPMMRGREEETGRHTVHKMRKNKIYMVGEKNETKRRKSVKER